jgi:hypothetical protein
MIASTLALLSLAMNVLEDNVDLDQKIRDLGVTLEINELLLEEEWTKHSQMVYNVGAYVAKLQFAADQAKYEFDVECAEIDQDIRRAPGKYAVEKVTEGSVLAAMRVTPEYRAAHSNLLNARLELQHAQAAANALEHKKRALSMLVDLYTHEYYCESGRGSSGGNGQMTEEEREAEKKDIRSRGRRRREALAKEDGKDPGD